jgi:threonine/homoserine/homoserine lactone efflux protein
MDPLYLFVFLGLFSPGPNVILLTASGARFGFRPTLPHVAGVALGVGVTAGLTGLGIGALLEGWPVLKTGLSAVAAAWIGVMAWRLWHSEPGSTERRSEDRPWGVTRAALFQWVNPKVWAIAVAAASGYSLGLPPIEEAQRLALAFAGINLFVCLFWSFAGSLLSLLLRDAKAWSIFARIMAAGLGASAVMVFL